ncbi:MAG: hypothetical protein INH41_17035 [Myxococcaceae bacterium]|jgi:hypothetical protein|nr:hypothetical protein [Myxococcaceae bacterium]
MRRLLAVTVALAALSVGAPAVLLRERWLAVDPAFDTGTTVAPSRIPGAGEGLFAARDFAAGEVIAEMGGRLVFYRDYPPRQRGYLVTPPPCARADLWPYDAVDGAQSGGRAWKVNFAPSRINGVDTHFQNARGLSTCERPYVSFETTRAVAKGEEFLVGYGPNYEYDFMALPQVRDHFCGRLGLDCTQRFDWAP